MSTRYFGADGVTPLVFLPEALDLLGVSPDKLELLLRHGRLARPGCLPKGHPSGHLVAWLASDIDSCKKAQQ